MANEQLAKRLKQTSLLITSRTVMFSLLREKAENKTTIYRYVSRSDKMASKLRELRETGLIHLDNRPFENNTTLIGLTSEGRFVAKKSMEIQRIFTGGSVQNEKDDIVCSSATVRIKVS